MQGTEKTQGKIQILEQEVARKLEDTGLVTNVDIKGELKNSGESLYLEYKIKQEDTGNKEIEIRMLRRALVNILIKNHPEIKEVKKDYRQSGLRREILIINPEAVIEDEYKLKCDILRDIKKETENYLMRRKHAV